MVAVEAASDVYTCLGKQGGYAVEHPVDFVKAYLLIGMRLMKTGGFPERIVDDIVAVAMAKEFEGSRPEMQGGLAGSDHGGLPSGFGGTYGADEAAESSSYY